MAVPKSRRETIKNRPRTYRKLDKTPIEIPAGRKTIPDTKAMVKQYVAQAIAQAGGDTRSAEQFLDEELDLDPEDPDPPWVSQFEVTEMDEVEEIAETPSSVLTPEPGPTALPETQEEEETPPK